MRDTTVDLPLDQIVEPFVLLRPVNRNSLEYMELRDSIQQNGFFCSISVRPSYRQPGKYEIIEGLHRYTVACELRLPTIPVIVKEDVSDDDVLAAQIQANACRPKTPPVAFAEHMERIMARRPEMTHADMARLISKSPQWVGQHLQLLHLQPEIKTMVDRGEIPLLSAFHLAKLPYFLRSDYIDQARTMKAAEFEVLMRGARKQYQESLRQGKLDKHYEQSTWEPQPYLRAPKELLHELGSHRLGPMILATEGCQTAAAGWYAALRWVLHLDKEAVEEQRQRAMSRHRS